MLIEYNLATDKIIFKDERDGLRRCVIIKREDILDIEVFSNTNSMNVVYSYTVDVLVDNRTIPFRMTKQEVDKLFNIYEGKYHVLPLPNGKI